jgi:phospholipid/cholesterol/gamma-HCH transport system substrate-binding protein
MEWKVGLFVLTGLILACAMIMRFSKGTGLSTTYKLNLEARNAGGIIPGAAVLMAGVPIGSVSDIYLAPDGSKVTMVASIYSRFKITKNAVFGIATVGFLGDKFISVSPGPIAEGAKHPGIFEDKDTIKLEEAFDITAVAQSASSLMDRLSGTVGQLSNAVQRLDKTLLAQTTLSNLTETVSNLRKVSERAVGAVQDVDLFVRGNSPNLGRSLTNFTSFTEKLNRVTLELEQTLATNRVQITEAVKNIGRATDRADKLLADVEAGKGLAGNLLKNDEMARHTGLILSNFMVLSSNINHRGLWGVIRKPKLPKD